MPASRVSLVFGATEGIEAVAATVAKLLGVQFELHDSSYMGGEYFLARDAHEQLIVQRNEELDGPAEPDFAEWPTLLRVEGTTRADEIEAALEPTAFFCLTRDTWPSP